MFLLPCSEGKIHFEFPVFEDHSYSTICNRIGLRNLIQKPHNSDKYIIFRTDDLDIVGYYKVTKEYYQETNMFNNNGYVWGIEAEPYLIKKGSVKYEGPRLRQGFRASWHGQEWQELLDNILTNITKHPNISDVYNTETNRLISFLKDRGKLLEWAEKCTACAEQDSCYINRTFQSYGEEHPSRDMLSVLNHVYSSSIYSRNILKNIPKNYLKMED